MAKISSRNQLIDMCLARLGFPVLTIQVSPEQLEYNIDHVFNFYRDYATSGVESVYLSYQVTAADITNKFITLSDNIMSVSKILPVKQKSKYGIVISPFGSGQGTLDTLSGQIGQGGGMPGVLTAGNYDLHGMCQSGQGGTSSIVGMVMNSQIYQHLSQFFYDDTQLVTSFSRNNGKLFFATGVPVEAGEFIVMEVDAIIDPESATRFYNNRWIASYATSVIKHQWASNLSAFSGIALPGGGEINGSKMLDEAKTEMKDLEQELRDEETLDIYIGWN
jgi:hypothetical protein